MTVKISATGLLLIVLTASAGVAHGSYLGIPRINFEGKFRADAATNNNDRMNFLFSSINPDQMELATSWNQGGTNSWSFVDCLVTSVVDDHDHLETDPIKDSVIGKNIVNNPDSTYAKFVDIDVDDQLLSSTIYGMTFGINWDPIKKVNNKDSFLGEYVPAVIATDVWERQPRSGAKFQQTGGARSVSKINNIEWSKDLISPALKQLKLAAKDKPLSIRLTVSNYSKNPEDNWFTYGHVVGSIGVAYEDESQQFPETRVMKYLEQPMPAIPDPDCQKIDDWMYGAYFDVDKTTVRIDFSNSFALGIQGGICNIDPYHVYVGININSASKTYEIISEEIPYKDELFYKKSAILDLPLGDAHLTLLTSDPHSKFVVVMATGTLDKGVQYTKCEELNFCKTADSEKTCTDKCVYVMLEEMNCLVRPTDISTHRLEMGDTAIVNLKVFHRGKLVKDRVIELNDQSPNGKATGIAGEDITYVAKNPLCGEEESTCQKLGITDENGIATFEFTAGDVGEPRGDIRLDGQVFRFGYCSHDCDTMECKDECEKQCRPTNEGNYLVFLVWSPFKEDKPYFWDKHIYPIFYQYQYLYPAMDHIVRLGDYKDVTKPQNVELIKMSMSLPVDHISYMPVTRDLSPSKRKMILEWFNTPLFPKSWDDIDDKLFKTPKFCEKNFVFHSHSKDGKGYIYSMDNEGEVPEGGTHIRESSIAELYSSVINFQPIRENPKKAVRFVPIHQRSESNDMPAAPGANDWDCNIVNLKTKLQTAIALEFATIPPYMTALYSIKEGFNQEVYSIIRSVVMQEMLHMAQAANLLISIGGQPQISDPTKSQIPTCFPSYLPGGILPGLVVKLAKASPMHIKDVFMMIEFPDKLLFEGQMHEGELTANALTIGQFYNSIKQCIDTLDKSEGIPFDHNTEKQLTWPVKMYDKSSNLYVVDSLDAAHKAIEMIVEQGEGSEQLDPTYLGTQHLAHFFKFGEVACKHSINASRNHYSFKGDKIKFDREGVWHMRDDPVSKNIPETTHAYHQAKVFHSMYLSLLNALQEAFDTGETEKLKDSMYIMESMQIQAKRLMQMEVLAPDGHVQTCGPIFDYKWQDEKCGQLPERRVVP